MVPVTADAVRLFLHVLAATVWVGGQLVLAGIVPAVRPAGQEVLTAVARRFQRVAWPAFALLFITGLWNLDAADYSKQTDEWQVTVVAKIGAFVVAGIAAAGHTAMGRRARQAPGSRAARRWRARAGASAGIALLASLAGLFWGVSLRAWRGGARLSAAFPGRSRVGPLHLLEGGVGLLTFVALGKVEVADLGHRCRCSSRSSCRSSCTRVADRSRAP